MASSAVAVKRLRVGIGRFREAQQRDHRRTKLPEFLGGQNALTIPESIQQANIRRTLPRKIVQVEQLNSACAFGPQNPFQFLFVENGRQFSAGFQVIVGQREQSLLFAGRSEWKSG